MADRRLQVFHAVAKQRSFTRAAEVLFMTQPAVTFQIKQLEEHFNSRLFDRGHGRNSHALFRVRGDASPPAGSAHRGDQSRV